MQLKKITVLLAMAAFGQMANAEKAQYFSAFDVIANSVATDEQCEKAAKRYFENHDLKTGEMLNPRKKLRVDPVSYARTIYLLTLVEN